MKRWLGVLVLLLTLAAATAFAEEEDDWTKAIRLTGYLDARVLFTSLTPNTDGVDSTRRSDVLMRYVSLGAYFDPLDYLTGRALITMENTADNLYVEEGYLTVRYPWSVTPYVTIGYRGLPTGSFLSYAVEYPLVYNLFAVYRTALSPGVASDYFDVHASLFNGSNENVDADGEAADDTIDTFIVHGEVYPLAFQEAYQLVLGGYYLNDATETDYDLSQLLQRNYEDNVPAYGVYLNFTLPFTEMIGLGFNGEYSSTGKFDKQNYVDNAGDETAISAGNIELALLLFEQSVQVGGKMEFVRGMDWLGMQANDPDQEITSYNRYGGFAGYDPWPFLHIGARYLAGADNEQNRDSEFQFQTAVTF